MSRSLFICNPDSGHPAWHAGEGTQSPPDSLGDLMDRFEEAGIPAFTTDDPWFKDCDCLACNNLSLLASHRLAVYEGRQRAAEWCLNKLAVR